MGIFNNRVRVDDYLKARKIVFGRYFDEISEEEHLINSNIYEKYNKENKYNPFRMFDEKYRPYIRYGNITRYSGKILYISFFMFFLNLLFSYYSTQFFICFYVFSTFMLFLSLWVHEKYRDKYETAKKIYTEERKNPNWERIKKLERLLEED